MNKTVLTALMLFICTIACAQISQTIYYSNPALSTEVPQEKAKFSKTIIKKDDGTITTITRNLKKDIVIQSKTYKGDEPFGVWVYQVLRGTSELDYNFQLNYSSENCVNGSGLENLNNYLEDNEAIGYKAPTLAGGYKSVMDFIVRNLRYPEKARIGNIQGTVHTSFIINKDGTISNIIITKGVNIGLDKEAVRTLRKLRFSAPPMFNGQPVSVCVKFPLAFQLA